MTRTHWERHAKSWAEWARRPGFDAYWQYAPSFFELVPAPQRRTLEVGCGEGRVTRDLVKRGHTVTAVDGSLSLVRLAKQSDPDGSYIHADAAALPFASGSFDLAVFYNSLMDVDEMEASVDEAARVLRTGGKLCVCVTHPIADAGQFAARDPQAAFVIGDAYLGHRRWLQIAAERDGLQMEFAGWAYPLEAYMQAHERAGLVIEALREPVMPLDTAEARPDEARWRRIPMFLMWRAAKIA